LKVKLLAQLLAMPMEYVAAEERGYGLFGARQVSQKQKSYFGGLPSRAEVKVRPAALSVTSPRSARRYTLGFSLLSLADASTKITLR
jgi:hypothetical protein